MSRFTVVTEPRPRLVIAKAKAFRIDRDRPLLRKKEVQLRKKLRNFFRGQAKVIAAKFRNLDTVSKAEKPVDPKLAKMVLAQINYQQWVEDLPALVDPFLTAIAIDSARLTASQLGLFDKDVLALMRARAKDWAELRAAELVSMRIVDGVLVANPDARWQILESTREMIARDVNAALREGLSPQELANRIEESAAFSEQRAIMVARTEMALADSAGTMEGFRASPDVVGKRWLTAQDDKVSEECLESEDAGAIKLEEGFPPNGLTEPPNHPNCRCAIVPVFANEM